MMSTCNEPEFAPTAQHELGTEGRASCAPALRRISSRSVLGADKEIEIDHEGVVYRLRITALGKLILTK